MSNWIEVKLRYVKIVENGMQKKVTEHYLVDALTFTEAEARTIEETAPFISGEFSISAAKKTKISEVVLNDQTDEIFFLAKLNLITLDEKSGIEKPTALLILIQASDFEDSLYRLKSHMKDSVQHYEISSISETPILEIFKAKLVKDEEVSD